MARTPRVRWASRVQTVLRGAVWVDRVLLPCAPDPLGGALPREAPSYLPPRSERRVAALGHTLYSQKWVCKALPHPQSRSHSCGVSGSGGLSSIGPRPAVEGNRNASSLPGGRRSVVKVFQGLAPSEAPGGGSFLPFPAPGGSASLGLWLYHPSLCLLSHGFSWCLWVSSYNKDTRHWI